MELDPKNGLPIVPLDDEAENWMQTHRLEQLRARGWTGTVKEWIQLFDELGCDPLTHNPPVTAP